jgi:hypothetical protein
MDEPRGKKVKKQAKKRGASGGRSAGFRCRLQSNASPPVEDQAGADNNPDHRDQDLGQDEKILEHALTQSCDGG